MTEPNLLNTNPRERLPVGGARPPAGRSPRVSRRSGISVVEVIAACTLLGTVTAVTLPLLGKLANVRQEASDRDFALRELRNQIEPFLGSGPDLPITLDIDAFARLEQPEFETQITSQEDGSQQVYVRLSWLNVADQRSRPVELVVWRFPEGRP